MELIYMDRDVIVCIKPPRILSTDEPGGLPELIRKELGDPNANIRTIHRLDRVVSGLMVVARSAKSASDLSRQVREGIFQKEYVAVIHGIPEEKQGSLRDLLWRSKPERKTYIVAEPGKDVQEAILHYQVLGNNGFLSRVAVELVTGRTHQIRAQFSGRGFPLVGDRKYSVHEDACEIALWSHKIGFFHPYTKVWMEFTKEPPEDYPWTEV